MIDVIEPAGDALELPMTQPPETEKLLSCNLLRQATCRHMQMIFSYFLNMSSITQLINLIKVKVPKGISEINGIHWDVLGKLCRFPGNVHDVGGAPRCYNSPISDVDN